MVEKKAKHELLKTSSNSVLVGIPIKLRLREQYIRFLKTTNMGEDR